ncbi:MAG TPA: HD domain-containing protein [Dermatophilaceae bacterium]|nr:HD domain-containing protein [Dermatophilaceae bacterium]
MILWRRRDGGGRLPRTVEHGVLAVALVIFGVAGATTVAWPVRGSVGVTMAAFVLVIAVGEYFRFTVEDEREIAPMSLAASIAFALAAVFGSDDLGDVGSGPIIVATGIAMALGTLPHLVRRRPVGAADVAARFLGVAVTAVVFRTLPIVDGRPLLHLEAVWIDERGLLAIVMSGVSGLGLLSWMIMTAVGGAARLQRDVRQTLSDELRAGAGLSLALSATGVLIALAGRPLGVVALPLFLMPLVLTQFALRQYSSIRATDAQTVRVLSRITEVGGLTRAGHSDRVTSLCVDLGHELGFSDRELRSLRYAALLHDVGQVALTAPIPGGATLMAAPADQRQIASDGADIVRKTGVPAEVARIVELQATPYRVVRELGQDLPMGSRILKVANAYDDLVGGSVAPGRREAALERIHLGLGYEYDPRVVDALERVLRRRRSVPGA